ncbi:MAG: glycosyltransferase [Terriglobia bacterium]
MSILRDVFFIGVSCSIVYYLLAVVTTTLFSFRAAQLPRAPARSVRATLLKPLHGFTEELASNLRSFMELDYQEKEYIFGITKEDDGALEAVKQIRRLYPDAQVRVTVGEEPSVNRKVGKLMRMLRHAPESEVLVMSDADVRVDRDYLSRVLAELDASESVGLVTCAYKGIAPAGSLGARLESLFINTDFTPTAIVSYYLEPMRHAFAATVAIRQSTLKEVGGLETVKNAFGDDFALARRVAALGYRIHLSGSIVEMVTERLTFRDFWNRQLRWARVDRKIRPASLARILINGPFWGMLLFVVSGFRLPWLAMAALAILARCGMAAWTYHRLLRLPVRASDLAWTLVKDLIMQAVWFASLFGDTVEWSGRKLRLLPTGEMEEAG